MAPSNLRTLLLQARDPGDPMADHEHACFAAAMGVPGEAVRCWSMLQGVPGEADLEDVDVLLVGGSGDYSVLGKQPWIRGFLDFLERKVVGDGFPTFASCFGFQGLVLAGGGVVLSDPDNAEVGTYDIHVTEAGHEDDLMRDLAPRFKAQLGHTDRAERLPDGCVHLAFSEQVPYQAFRVEGVPVFATQFHPELDREANTMRYRRYLENYRSKGVSSDEDDPVLKRMADSPHATALLPRWIRAVLASHR